MKMENISSSQAKSLMIMFILGTTLIVGGDPNIMEDIWISVLLAMAMAIPIVLIYGKLLQLFPDIGLFDILPKVYGKFLGKFFILIYTLYFLYLGSTDIRNLTAYIQVVSFPETPQYATAIIIGLLSLYAINAGFTVISTCAKMVLPIIILMIFATFILGIPQFNYGYIKPILYGGWKPIISGAYFMLTFPFAETVIFLVFYGYLHDKKNTNKIYISSVLIGGFLFLIIVFRNILLLGFPNLANIYFRSHYSTSVIRIGNFIQRMESLISLNLLLTSFIKIVICLYASSIGIFKLFRLKNFKRIPPLLCILMIILSMVLYKSTMDMMKANNVYKYIVIPFQFVIPILTLILVTIRKNNIHNIE